ncbi:MAG TPA: hypothetical protein ENJ56_07610 [Anaerolineae bacterium]|nr:hypothetical protein [Anaerolineae bacterium]
MSNQTITSTDCNEQPTSSGKIKSAQKRLFGLSIQLTLAQIAPLLTSLFVAGIIASFGGQVFSAYMLVSTINITTFIAASGLMQALYYLFGRALGRDEPQIYRATMIAARRWVWILSTTCFLVSICIGPITAFAGIDPELSRLAGQLGIISAFGLPPMFSVMLFRIHASINGRAGQVSMLYLIGGIITCCFALAITFFVDLDPSKMVQAIAGALVASNWILALAAWFLVRRPPLVKALHGKVAKIERQSAFSSVWTIGWPVALVIFLESLVSAISTVVVARFWPEYVPLHSVVLLWVTVGLVIPLGVAQATTQMVSIANASEDLATRNKLAYTAIVISIFFGGLAAVIMSLFPAELGTILLGREPIRAQAGMLEQIMWLGGIMLASQSVIIVSASALRGVGITRAPLALAIIGYLGIGVGGAVWLGPVLDYGVQGLWYGLIAGFVITAIAVTYKVYTVFGPATNTHSQGKVISEAEKHFTKTNQLIERKTL